MKTIFPNLNVGHKIIIIVYIVGFLIGGSHHWYDILSKGLLPYHSVPFRFNLFLTSLAFVDYLAILLLLTTPKFGIKFSAILMIVDISVDIYLCIAYWDINPLTNPGIQWLVIFTLFLLFSAKSLLRAISEIECGMTNAKNH